MALKGNQRATPQPREDNLHQTLREQVISLNLTW